MKIKHTVVRLSFAATFAATPLLSSIGFAADAASSAAPAAAPATKPADAGFGVAVLDFEANNPGNPELGKQISEVLIGTLSGEAGFQLVDRAQMHNVLRENALNLTGMVNPEQATKVGKLVGAKIIITGKVFALDKQMFITAKLIGTETTLVDGVVIKGPREGDTGELLMQLSQKVGEKLRTSGPKLLAANEAAMDPLPALKEKLAGRKLPVVGISIVERHVAPARGAGIDPAVDTEVKNVLMAAGIKVVDGKEREWDRGGVELAITGEAFSEFNARIGNLTSCSARTEMKVVNRKDNTLVFADRATTRAVDLAENLAGKTALQKGGRELAIRLLQKLAADLPAAEKAK